jgi:hypothetical protein
MESLRIAKYIGEKLIKECINSGPGNYWFQKNERYNELLKRNIENIGNIENVIADPGTIGSRKMKGTMSSLSGTLGTSGTLRTLFRALYM